MAMAVVDNNDDVMIFIAPSNASSCTDNSEDDKLYMSTTLYVILMILYSTTSSVAISNITLHLLIKDLRTIAGMLLMLLCASVIIIYIAVMGYLTDAYINETAVVLEIVLENIFFLMLIVYQAIKLTILYHFVYLMYLSYKLVSKKDETV